MSRKANQLRKRLRIETERAAKTNRDIEAKVRADARVQRAEQEVRQARRDFLEKLGMLRPLNHIHCARVQSWQEPIRRTRRFRVELPLLAYDLIAEEFEIRGDPMSVAGMVAEEFAYALKLELPKLVNNVMTQMMRECGR